MNRRLSVLLATVVAVGAIAVAPAMAQDVPETDFSVDIRITPKKAGTPKNPQGHKLTAVGKWSTEAGFDPPIVTGADVLTGKGLVWNGGAYARCSRKTLNREGPKGCPRKSIMGKARGTAKADTVTTHPDIVFVNGGSRTLFAYTTLYHPTLVQEAIPIRSAKLKGKWANRDTLRVPENLQVVAGVPIQLTGGSMTLGGKPYARNYIYSTSCPKGGWKYKVTTFYLYDLTGQRSEDTIEGAIPCTK